MTPLNGTIPICHIGEKNVKMTESTYLDSDTDSQNLQLARNWQELARNGRTTAVYQLQILGISL